MDGVYLSGAHGDRVESMVPIGQHTWAGNYKAGIWNATPWSGGGLGTHTAENPFKITTDPNAHGKEIHIRGYYYGEEVAYWNHGDTALIVNTPKYGRRVFTGKTHMPTPSKFRWVANVNVLNNAKHHYDMVKNVDPHLETIHSLATISNIEQGMSNHEVLGMRSMAVGWLNL